MEIFDVVIVGSGPAGLGGAFALLEARPGLSILILDREQYSTGGLRNDCKMNFTFPIGFPQENWEREEAEHYLEQVKLVLKPNILPKENLLTYQNRAERLGAELLNVQQTHLGTDGGLELIKQLTARLRELGVAFALKEEMLRISEEEHVVHTNMRTIGYGSIIIAPGRKGFRFLQNVMDSIGVPYVDHIV